jgi:hypothetical protein
MIAPIFEQLSNQYPSVKFCKIDVDELQVRCTTDLQQVLCSSCLYAHKPVGAVGASSWSQAHG